MVAFFLACVWNANAQSTGRAPRKVPGSDILLDDPVEHFDDLNSYSLIGLIKRLASRGRYDRQFIISTCDEQLYRLMCQQFNNMDGKVVYHKFLALTEKGPII